MCGVMLAMIIFVLDLFKFPVTLNFLHVFPRTPASSCCCSLASSSLRCLSISAVHIPYSPSSSYTIQKQFYVFSPVFLQGHLVLLSRVLRQRCIILKLYFSKMYPSFVIYSLRNLFQILWREKRIKGNFTQSFWHAQVILHFEVVIYRSKNLWKTNLKMTIQLLKLYLELTIYRCKNDEHTPKDGDFN